MRKQTLTYAAYKRWKQRQTKSNNNNKKLFYEEGNNKQKSEDMATWR